MKLGLSILFALIAGFNCQTTTTTTTTTTRTTTTTTMMTTTTTTTLAPFTTRQFVFVIGDPHLGSLPSASNPLGYQVCDETGAQNFLTSTYLNVAGTLTAVATKTVTYLSAFTITFKNAGATVATYSDNAANFRLDAFLDDGNTLLNDTTTNKTWLKIWSMYNVTSGSIFYSMVGIQDTRSNSTLGVIQYSDPISSFYSIIAYVPYMTLQTSTGLWVTGCPSASINTVYTPSASGRRRRGVEERVTVNAACTGVTGSDVPALSQSVLQNICTTDVTETGNPALAAATVLAALGANNVKTVDAAAFGAAGSSFNFALKFAFSAILLNIYFLFV